MPPDNFDAKAREIVKIFPISGEVVNNYTISQIIAAALRDADQAGYRRAKADIIETMRNAPSISGGRSTLWNEYADWLERKAESI